VLYKEPSVVCQQPLRMIFDTCSNTQLFSKIVIFAIMDVNVIYAIHNIAFNNKMAYSWRIL